MVQPECPLSRARTTNARKVRRLTHFFRVSFCLVFLLLARSTAAQTGVVTQHYDNSRTGANTNETILTPSNVNPSSFARLFSYSVDGYVYAQPLYMPGVTLGSGTPQAGTSHNVIFIAT